PEVSHDGAGRRRAAADAAGEEPGRRPAVQDGQGSAADADRPVDPSLQHRRAAAADQRRARTDEPGRPAALAVPRKPDVRPVAPGAAVGAARHHRAVAGLPSRPRRQRFPSVDPLRPALRGAHVGRRGSQDRAGHDPHPRRQMVRAAHVDHPAAEAAAGGLIGSAAGVRDARVAALRALAIDGLARMYDEARGLFVFCVRRTAGAVVPEGHSHRYTAISLLGLANESRAVQEQVLRGRSLRDAAQALVQAASGISNLGDLSVIAWAGHVCGCDTTPVWAHIAALRPDVRRHPTVEVAWTLSALATDASSRADGLRDRLADRLCRAFSADVALFPHILEESSSTARHVSCFADFVYPTLALAQYALLTGSQNAARCATRSAEAMCERQGAAGQWWWHYDCRTGRVL